MFPKAGECKKAWFPLSGALCEKLVPSESSPRRGPGTGRARREPASVRTPGNVTVSDDGKGRRQVSVWGSGSVQQLCVVTVLGLHPCKPLCFLSWPRRGRGSRGHSRPHTTTFRGRSLEGPAPGRGGGPLFQPVSFVVRKTSRQ